ncbi:putative ribonuclease H-like domain-containing protein [Tanacetum coccineum]
MDVKSAFLYGKIEEEVYVCQPPGFEDPEFPDRVYKVEKALYSLHQAHRAWYETLYTYLLDNGFQRGQIDKTLFIKRVKGDILLVQVYVDGIIFRSTRNEMCNKFEKMMHKKFQMSSMGELTFFLGLQVAQKDDGIFISQDKYVDEILKKFGFSTVKTTSTPMETLKLLLKDAKAEDVDVHLYRSMIGSLMYLTTSRPDIIFVVCACARFQVTPKVSHLHAVKRIFRYLKGHPKLGLWYPRDSPFDLEAFFDSDYAGASLDRKSTTGGCQFLRRRLISWQCKKQTIVANSTTEAEYVAAANCCGQVLWIQNQLLDYGYNFMNTKIYIDNESTICIVKNPVFHSKTKHIEIRHHFIRDSYEKRLIQVIKIHTDHNVADLLTKAFDVSRFQYLIARYLEWNGTTAKDEFQVSAVRVTYYWQVYLMLLVAFNIVVKIKNVEPIKQKWVKDETVIKEWEDIMEKAATNASSLEAEQDNGNINRTQSMATLNESFPQGTDSGSGPSFIKYALTVNPTTYESCIQQFWAIAKAKIVNGERHIQALVDKKKVIITKKSVRSDLMLEDAEGIECLPNDREGKGFSRRITPLFQSIMVQAPEDMEPISDKTTNEEPISTPSCDPPQSGKDRLQLTELMNLCTKLQKHVLDLEEAKTAQVKEIASLNKRVKQLKKRKKSRTSGLKRLRKVGSASMVETSNDVSLGAQEDASKQGRKIADLDADAEVTLIDETQERNDEDMFFDVQDDLKGEEVVAEKELLKRKLVLLIQLLLLMK